MGKKVVVRIKPSRSSVDLRARSKIIVQKPKIDTMSLEERRRKVIELNRALSNIEHPNSEYDFMLTKTKKSNMRKAIKILKRRVTNTGIG